MNLQDNKVFISKEETIKLMTEYSAKGLVLWVGAGIDCDPPTNLPLAQNLVKQILDCAFGPTLSEKFLINWQKNKKYIDRYFDESKQLPGFPRLESVIEAIREFEGVIKCPNSVISGFKGFVDAHPNNNHYVLAHLLHQGANIITTNYTLCIPKAYNELFTDKGYSICIEPIKKRDGVYILNSNYTNAGTIYFIHGIASHLEDLGASWKHIKNSLPKFLTEMLDQWIEKDHCFVYLGYSGGDTYDVNKYFKSKGKANEESNRQPSIGIYVRHNSEMKKAEKDINVRPNENILTGCFSKQYICFHNTGNLLSNWGVFQETYEWQRYFQPFPKQLQDTLITTFSYMFGINVSLMASKNWWKLAQNYDCIQERYIDFNCYRAAELQGNRRLTAYFAERLISYDERSEEIKAEFKAGQFDYKGSILNSPPFNELPDEIDAIISNGGIVPWSISTYLHRHVSNMLIDIVKNPIFVKRKIQSFSSNAEIIMRCLEKIIQEGNKCILELNQMNTAYRALGLCKILFENNLSEAEKYINLAVTGYVETSYINGVSVSLLYNSIIHSFDYYNRRVFSSWKKAVHFWRQASSLIKKSKENRYRFHKFFTFLFTVYVLVFGKWGKTKKMDQSTTTNVNSS